MPREGQVHPDNQAGNFIINNVGNPAAINPLDIRWDNIMGGRIPRPNPVIEHGEEYLINGLPVRCGSCRAPNTYLFSEAQIAAQYQRRDYAICGSCGTSKRTREAEQRRLEERQAEQLRRQERMPAQINNYSFKPEPEFKGRSSEGLFFGIEHEVEVKRPHDPSEVAWQVYQACGDQRGLFYFKQDGSIQSGFEMVSHPMSFNYFDKHYPEEVKKLISDLTSNQYNGAFECGIHIHMSRDAFGKAKPVPKPTEEFAAHYKIAGYTEIEMLKNWARQKVTTRQPYHLFKFMQFIHTNPKFVQNIAGRSAAIVHGQEMAEYDAHKAYTQEVYDATDRNGRYKTLTGPKVVAAAAAGKFKPNHRYVAVNLCNTGTVELRIFRSTTNHRRLRAYVQFADALFYYSKKSDLVNKRNPKMAMSIEGFEEYVRARPVRYEDLIEVLNNNPDLAV